MGWGLGYEPDTQLIQATDQGGQRHDLNGRPVHAGAGLELQPHDGHGWRPATNAIASPAARLLPTSHCARRLAHAEVSQPPTASFPLPTRAILQVTPREAVMSVDKLAAENRRIDRLDHNPLARHQEQRRTSAGSRP